MQNSAKRDEIICLEHCINEVKRVDAVAPPNFSPLAQIIWCHLFVAEPLHKPILVYCQFNY